MSTMLQTLLVVLALGALYASYVHNEEFYHKIFAVFPDISRLWRRSGLVKIEVFVPHSEADRVKNTIKSFHSDADPIIVTRSSQ